ncbi:MAG: GTPase HflX [Phycisphaerales bacterium]|nr:GTPase HflX [Phycisphaerales bacterium]
MSQPKERTDIRIQAERAVLAAVHLPDSRFDERDPLGELRALALTAGAATVGEIVQRRQRPEAGTYMGRGKLEELKAMCDEVEAGVVIFDHELSPKQISNIEKTIERKVLDRSELILDIFANRATTHQAKLQVELAQLEYTYPRLRAMWSHLERIVGSGGIGGVGTRGPGEQQLEIDRRLVQNRRVALRRELEEIQARKSREVFARKLDHFTVGLVGYTNAGKSTLFNTLTAGGAHANDQLFATLMTRTREWNLGRGVTAMLSDTVGFVRDLPHNLIASFKATLEEATHADLLLIVLDVSDPAARLQYDTVVSTLEEIFADVRRRHPKDAPPFREPECVLLLNKADRLRDNAPLLMWERETPGAIPFCALEEGGLGHEALIRLVLDRARGEIRTLRLTLPLSDAKAIDVIEKRTDVTEREYHDGRVTLTTSIGSRQIQQIRASGARLVVEGESAEEVKAW